MTKCEFLLRLGEGLSGISKELVNEQLDFYSEIIDDRIEEGLTEDEAVLEIGDIERIISQIKEEKNISEIPRDKEERKLTPWTIVLLVLGSPIWLSIIIAIISIVFSLIISLWAIEAALLGCAVGGTALGVITAVKGSAWSGVAIIGLALICVGVSTAFLLLCITVTRSFFALSKKIYLRISSFFTRKEA